MRIQKLSCLSVGLFSLTLLAGVVSAQVSDNDTLREVLTPTGTLRAAFLGRNPVQVRVDPQTGEVTGPAVDVARQIGGRMGVEVTIQPLSGVPAVIEAVREGGGETWSAPTGQC